MDVGSIWNKRRHRQSLATAVRMVSNISLSPHLPLSRALSLSQLPLSLLKAAQNHPMVKYNLQCVCIYLSSLRNDLRYYRLRSL